MATRVQTTVKPTEWPQGCEVYVPCRQSGWQEAVVTECTDDTVKVMTSSGQALLMKCSQVVLRNGSIDYRGTTNLTQLTPLHIPAVLHCLLVRYSANLIYTRAGSTLVSVNPFVDIDSLFGPDVITKYHNKQNNKVPHIYEVAESAYQCLKQDRWRQCVIVSGESGAGKTVSARHILSYLVTVATQHSNSSVGHIIEQRILDSSPILEAFGNASTLRNSNSSRFGKYLELFFDRSCYVQGARIRTYLLEKTRVFKYSAGEKNFHIFEQMLSGRPDLVQAVAGHDHQLEGPTNPSSKADFQELQNALRTVGVDDTTVDTMFKVLIALLMLKKIDFIEDRDDETATIISPDSEGWLFKSCSVLGLHAPHVLKNLTYRCITAARHHRQSVFYKPCNEREANNRRNCLLACIYTRLFDWLVTFINTRISTNKHVPGTIGILDIYGFESFQSNSLEQLCINYANERLQQHYVTYFLRDLQEEYIKEAVPWNLTQFTDNKMTVQLLDGLPSIFSIINEECSLNRSVDDLALVNRLLSSVDNLNLLKPRCVTNSFTIVHYAGSVTYQVTGLLEKNKDNVPIELLNLLANSTVDFIQNLVQPIDLDPMTHRKWKTVLSKFKGSLDQLMDNVMGSEPHYVRCIKPHTDTHPAPPQGAYILQQLEACGIVQAVNISKQAYTAQLLYEDFIRRYGLLIGQMTIPASDENKENHPPPGTPAKNNKVLKLRRRTGLSSSYHCRGICECIMDDVFSSATHQHYQLGRTKLFLKDGQLELLEAKRAQKLNDCAQVIQKCWRRYCRYRRAQRISRIVLVQKVLRRWLVRRELLRLRQAATVIQTAYRRYRVSGVVHRFSSSSVVVIGSSELSPSHTRSNSIGFIQTTSLESALDQQGKWLQDTPAHTQSMMSMRCQLDEALIEEIRALGLRLQQAYRTRCRVQVYSSTLIGLQYVEYCSGILSRRRLPRVTIKFHTRPNKLLTCGHFLNQREFQCSLTDCLPAYDQ